MGETLIKQIEVKGVYNCWGIQVYDYTLLDCGKTTKYDYQDLLTNVCLNRATGIEKEVTPLAAEMEARNTQLKYLGEILGYWGELGTMFGKEPTEKTTASATMSAEAIYGLQIAIVYNGGSWANTQNNKCMIYYPGVGDNNQKEVSAPNNSTTWYYRDYQLINQLTKSTIDALNNDAQVDMTRLQSLINRRDESYTLASDVMSSTSDSRSNLIKSI